MAPQSGGSTSSRHSKRNIHKQRGLTMDTGQPAPRVMIPDEIRTALAALTPEQRAALIAEGDAVETQILLCRILHLLGIDVTTRWRQHDPLPDQLYKLWTILSAVCLLRRRDLADKTDPRCTVQAELDLAAYRRVHPHENVDMQVTALRVAEALNITSYHMKGKHHHSLQAIHELLTAASLLLTGDDSDSAPLLEQARDHTRAALQQLNKKLGDHS